MGDRVREPLHARRERCLEKVADDDRSAAACTHRSNDEGVRTHAPAPRTVGRCWAAAVALFLAWSTLSFGAAAGEGRPAQRPRPRTHQLALDALLAASAAPLLLLFALDFLDTWRR